MRGKPYPAHIQYQLKINCLSLNTRKNTKGYNKPELDLSSYPGLDLATKSGYGVCRNMADHAARALNAIDENYNARTVFVYADGDGYELADIDRFIYDDGTDDKSDEVIGTEGGITNIFGNHAVVICNSLEDKDVQIVFCPTNPSVGVFINGKIHMFNSIGDNPYTYEYKPLGAIILNGSEGIKEIPTNFISSMGIYTGSKMKYYESKYGVEAQNRALQEVEAINPKSFYDISSQKVIIRDHKDSEEKMVDATQFFQRIKVDKDDLEQVYYANCARNDGSELER